MEFTITLTDAEQKYAEGEVARHQESGEKDLTLDTYVQRRVSKLFASEVVKLRVDVRTHNVGVLEQFVEALPADPVEPNAQLEKIGLRVNEAGKIVATE